jgi:tetratricopeptide (TPR) repeat protein
MKCAATLGILCLLQIAQPFAHAGTIMALPENMPTFWWPVDFAGSDYPENIPGVSSQPAKYAPAIGTNPVAAASAQLMDGPAGPHVENEWLASCRTRLADARNLVNTRQFSLAESTLIGLLAADVPDEIRQNAMLNLGALVQEENDLPRAQDIFAQFLDRWPGDPHAPEILLRQGDIFRQMGLDSLALTKFYSVMTAALSLKNDQFANYERLVLQAQVHIAETHYQSGRFTEAVDFYSRLLKHIDNNADRMQIQFRLIRSLNAIGRNEEASGQAQDFLAHYQDASDEPEVRYYLAQSLKAAGQSDEALRQVLIFLRDQKKQTTEHPEVWAYWQQRVGNEIANQLYNKGDYVNALELYLSLSALDSADVWRLPVEYQVGITYERLSQPQKAINIYDQILVRETELGTNATPGLTAIFDMVRWRVGFLEWQNKAEADIRSSAVYTAAAVPSATNTPSEEIIQ